MQSESDDNASNSSWEDVEDEEEDTSSGSTEDQPHSLLMNSLILEKVFEFLPTKGLQDCRLVCKEWNRTTLLRRLLGSNVEVKITKSNFDGLLRVAKNASQAFCRCFEFRSMEFEMEKISKFNNIFGERICSLSIKFCTAFSAEPVIKLFNCPRLEELVIYGALPDIQEDAFHSFSFTRLKMLSIYASVDYGQISANFIRLLFRHAPNLQRVKLGYSISLWEDVCSVLNTSSMPKLCQIEFVGIDVPLQIEYFNEGYLSKGLILQKLYFYNCLVSQDFMEQFFTQNCKYLSELHLLGTQHEILTKAFCGTTLVNLKRLTLPLDGIGLTEGNYVLQACPNIKNLLVSGLFDTLYTFQNECLVAVVMRENSRSTLLSDAILNEKQREFLKVLALVNLQPEKLEINLPNSRISSKCFRAVYRRYPELKYFSVYHKSTRDCIVGLTGIPYRKYRRIAHCKSFAVMSPEKVFKLPSISTLKHLQGFKLVMMDEMLNEELTLLLFVYGISQICSLKKLDLSNIQVTDVALMTLAQRLSLSKLLIDGTERKWERFQCNYKQHTIKSFLLPPLFPSKIDPRESATAASETVGMSPQLVIKILENLEFEDIFNNRTVCKYWSSLSRNYLHRRCKFVDFTIELENRISQRGKGMCQQAQTDCYWKYSKPNSATNLSKLLDSWSRRDKETSLAFISLEKSVLEKFQADCRKYQLNSKRNFACGQRKLVEYWYYPDGSDEVVSYPFNEPHTSKDTLSLDNATTLLAIGCWNRKDDGLLKFLDPKWTITTVNLIGLQKEALDLILPKLTQVLHLESLCIKPLSASSIYCELTKTHLQILCNSSFNLKHLTMRLHAPSEALVEFIKSQRFTLETLELHSLVNISDRLTFSMPQLKILQLDESPGCLLWTTLNVHSSLQTISFGRSCGSSNQVKNKSSPKVNPLEADFEHSATEILCDVNWFLENAISRSKSGFQKSILQQGSDNALQFFTHFPFLSALTLRGVHAHYGILQGIFRKFPQLKKLELINATGVTDEILTGFSRDILNEMDIMNPFHQVRGGRKALESPGKVRGSLSIRNLKSLTHLMIDDQPSCTDFSVIFGLLKLQKLEYLSCRKWKITDISIRAITDILPTLREIDASGCSSVSKYALKYFNENRLGCNRM